MKKPVALSALLEELQGEHIRSEVEVFKTSKAILYTNEEAARDDDGIELNAKECQLLFANPSTVERFIESLHDTQDASITLFEVTIPGSILELLERGFAAVDEG